MSVIRLNFPVKVVLLGDGFTGKSSVLVRYISNEYDGNRLPAGPQSFSGKRIEKNGVSLLLSVWGLFILFSSFLLIVTLYSLDCIHTRHFWN